MRTDLITRIFVEADYDAVVALWKKSEGIEVAEGDERGDVASYLGRNPNLSRVAECAGKIVGAVLCGYDGRRGLIYHLAVEAEFQGQGLGHQLVKECVDGLRAVGVKRVLLLVADDNEKGLAFWAAQGFEQIKGAIPLGMDVI